MMNFLSNAVRNVMVFAVITLFSSSSGASVVIHGTRVIYPSDDKEVSVSINNVGTSPVLLQSWIDDGVPDAKPSAIKVPFVITPPINRIEGGKSQTLRISYTGSALPMDKESVFWLNVLEVPAKNKAKSNQNTLQMAFRSRIKLFFRPAGLEGDANEAAKALTWRNQGGRIHVTNPTPYYVSLVRLSINGKELDGPMINPLSTQELALSGNAGNKISVSFVNDYGAVRSIDAIVK